MSSFNFGSCQSKLPHAADESAKTEWIDFDRTGAYSLYNRETFFRAPSSPPAAGVRTSASGSPSPSPKKQRGFSKVLRSASRTMPSPLYRRGHQGRGFRSDRHGVARGQTGDDEAAVLQFHRGRLPAAQPTHGRAWSASVIAQLVSRLPLEDSPISVAIEPLAERSDPGNGLQAKWASMLMASALSENHERFVLKKCLRRGRQGRTAISRPMSDFDARPESAASMARVSFPDQNGR